MKSGQHKKLKFASLAAIYTVLFFAGIVLVNALVGILTDRFFLKMDLTAQSIYEVDPETQRVLSEMNDNVTIYVLAPDGDYSTNYNGAVVEETLQKYQSYAGNRLDVQYIDPNLNPLLLQPYVKEKPLEDYQIIVTCGSNFKILDNEDLFETQVQYDPYGYGIPVGERVVGFRFDKAFTSAIQSVLLDIQPVVTFVTGHGESDVTELQEYFEDANFQVGSADLSRDGLPEDTKLLVILAPTSDFTADEIAIVDRLLETAASVIYFSHYGTPVLPVLDRFLESWGITFERALPLDAANNFGKNVLEVATVLSDHELNQSLQGTDSVTLLPMSRPIVCPWIENRSGFRAFVSLVDTAKTAYARLESEEQLTQSNIEQREGDLQGPFSLAALTVQTIYDSSANTTTSAVLALPTYLLQDPIAQIDSFSDNRFINGLLFNNAVSYLTQEGKSVVIASKSLAVEQLNDTTKVMTPILILMVILMPLGILIVGLVVWMRRRTL